jgi:hypothetical protein
MNSFPLRPPANYPAAKEQARGAIRPLSPGLKLSDPHCLIPSEQLCALLIIHLNAAIWKRAEDFLFRCPGEEAAA